MLSKLLMDVKLKFYICEAVCVGGVADLVA